VGPKFIYPDGRLQEVGAFIDGTGEAIQYGKFGEVEQADIERTRIVDYCSAACLLMRADLFSKVAGFDFIYEPAYYEDVDLCFKIASLGYRIYCCPDSVVTHIENATSSANSQQLGLHSIVAINRLTFLSRWGDWLRARDENR